MADFRLGRLKFNWRGDWAAATAYVIDDIVKFGANTYVCTTNHTSVADETSWYATDLAKWSLHTEGVVHRGTWTSGVYYKINDVIEYGNTQYRVTTGFSTNTFGTTYLTEYLRGFQYEDTWSSATEYQPGDFVTYGGYSYVATSIHTNKIPSDYLAADWDVVTTGFDAVGTYSTTTNYKPGDVVQFGGYAYVADAKSINVHPTVTSSWNLIVPGIAWKGAYDGATTYELGDAVSRNSNSYVSVASSNTAHDPATDTLGTYWNSLTQGAETNVLTTGGDMLIQGGSGAARLPVGAGGSVLTVSGSGYPEWQSNNVTDPVYYVTEEGSDTNSGENISNSFATLGKALSVVSSNATIYMKAGIYNETLPLVVPPDVTVVGDNIRTTKIKAASGNSNTWTLSLNHSLLNVAFGSVIQLSNGARLTYIDSNSYENSIDVIRDTNYAPPTSSTIISTIDGAGYSGPTTTITSATNATNAHSKMFLMSDKTMLKDLQMEGLTGYTVASTAHTASGSISGNTLTSSDLIDDYVGTTITGTGVAANTKIVNVLSATSAEVSVSQTVTTTALTFTAPPQDINNAHIKGVYISLNPSSPITKSPYISQCSAFSTGGVGAVVDGRIHRHFPVGSATPSNKSIVFDSFTNIHDNGVSFWVTNNAAAEFVSCFSYYAHISYAATRGGRIRSLAGNSSWGTYGLVSSGYNFDETPITGAVEGLQVKFDPTTITGAGFNEGGRFIGQSSGAEGYINSSQTDKLIYQLVTAGPLGLGTGFSVGETIRADNGTTADLVPNTDCNTGINGFTFPMSGLPAGMEDGGSVEFVTGSGNGGFNNQVITGADQFTYVVSNVSYRAPDGRGSIQVTRGQLGSVAAGHTGGAINGITAYPEAGVTETLLSNVGAGDTTIFVSSTTGFTQGGYAKVADELMKIVTVVSSTSLEVERSADGSGSAGSYNNGAATVAIGASTTLAAELFKDAINSDTEIRVDDASVFATNQFLKIDSEFMDVTAVNTDTLGTSIIVLAEEKSARAFDGQSVKIRFLYSQGRFTGHDFLQVGTGGTTTTNWPGTPTQDPVQTQEVVEDFPGRVFYVSADSNGNFRVGRYFKVNQATGSATLNASAFDLSGLSSLRLGSIGAQLGAQINEFSTDTTLSQNSNEKVPTQAAVKAYIDNADTATKTSARVDGYFLSNSL